MRGICGIAGGPLKREEREQAVRRMNDALVHRGPDDQGLVSDATTCIAMRRLSIIDVAGGHQPLANEDERIHLVLNGEIYNYRDLQTELTSLGHRLRSASDAEVVLHLYEQDATTFVSDLRGMFAFALWDAHTQRLTLACDRFGIKPLYYSRLGDGLMFASELGALLASGLIDEEIDLEGLLQYFSLTCIPAPRTINRKVSKLSPAEMLTWSRGNGLQRSQYWEFPHIGEVPSGSLDDLRRRLREELRGAVQSHMVSDVPIGAFLSGGMDSGAVVALMSEVSSVPVKTFTIAFPDRAHDESAMARMLADRFGTEHHELTAEPATVDTIPLLARHFGEPFGDSSALPTYLVSRLASEHVKVVLSGDGGDESFLGYTTFKGMRMALKVSRLPAWLRRASSSLISAACRASRPLAGDASDLWQKRLSDTLLPPEEAFLSKMAPPGLADVMPLLDPELRAELAGIDGFAPVRDCFATAAAMTASDPLEPFIFAKTKVGLCADMLVKVDRMSMANSLEVRVPLLDHLLVEWAGSLPIEQRMPRGRLKGLFRDTMADVLPKQTVEGAKRGFTMPVSSWLRATSPASCRASY